MGQKSHSSETLVRSCTASLPTRLKSRKLEMAVTDSFCNLKEAGEVQGDEDSTEETVHK
jgi:hypothetical protein